MNLRNVSFVVLGMVSAGLTAAMLPTDAKVLKKNAPAAKAPAVTFSAPIDESNVSATVPVHAVASRVEQVKGVTFYLDGEQVSKATGPSGGFKWDTTKTDDGWHTLTAVAKDSSGKMTEARVAVMVKNFKDTVAPSVAITWPVDGSRKGEWVTTRVRAVDNIGVTTVETYVDGKLVATSSAAPFDTKWRWNKISTGLHSVKSKAYDAAGNARTSNAISFTK
ncbi:MAG: hypothetical protein QOJ65_1921 [Fimbriimonadaceae bacterium]|jgi:hypothetical protein|nr:hypothetical protein [Fimbriimonadaceae bacterium]